MEEFTLYTIEQISDILKVTKRTIYNYIKSNDLKAVKFGKYWRVKHFDFQEFIDNGTNKK
ncbi:MAG: helix-turn-helix domain-containing protein [Firmicutes bacterium]|nr:helix-turn-helix domain-containing protein [Bacillota bacterium]